MAALAQNETRSTCCYCGVGCGVIIEGDGQQVTGVRGDPDHPANFGRLCSKGSTLALTMQPGAMSARALYPEMRMSRDQPRQRASWDATLDHLARIFADTIEKHGPDSVGFYVSGQLLTEDYYVFNKLAKGLIGTNNIDTNSRLCMSSAVTGYQATLGVDAPPCSYEDIDQAQCLFIAGSNTAWAHPVLFRRIEAARERNPNLKMIVVDPRRTETARAADLHLSILPGTDVALFHAMLHVMLWEAWIDRDYIAAHTEGFDLLRTLAREYSPQAAAEICGIKADDIITAARWFATAGPTLSLYCQGLNQSTSGTAKNASLINLHLATGQIGKPGAGPFSLTGQPNAMGGREVGGLATTLAAHRDFANPEHRAEMMRLWGVDRISSERGKTAVEMFDAVKRGDIKLLWIACTNPAQSMPDLANIRTALEAAEMVVLQEAYANTETAEFADVLLPATSWGEKEGTVTNSERRISRVRAALPGPGEARHDWQSVCEFARRLEQRLRPARESLFNFETAEAVWNEHRAVTAGRDLDISGMSWAMLESAGPQQWPLPADATSGQARLYADGRFPTASGKAKFLAAPYKPVAEKADARHPIRLTTGRLRDQWHALSRTGTVARLFGHAPEPALAMNPGDLARRGLADGDLVSVQSKRGALHIRVEADDSIRSGQASLPMHWGARYLGGQHSFGVNTLTTPAFDSLSRQPELKHAAVRVDAAALPWRLVAFVALPPGELVALHDALRALQVGIAWLSAVPMGRGTDRRDTGLLVRAAHAGAPAAEWVDRLDRLLDLAGADVIRYDDTRRGSARRLRIADNHLIAARLSGGVDAVVSAEWLRDWMLSGRDVTTIRRLLLAPGAAAPAGFVPAGRMLCNCFGVSEEAVRASLAAAMGDAGQRLAATQATLKCGTHCGSCLPEMRGMAKSCEAAPSASTQLVEAA
ncbi:MAG: molybdopterin-dependent oxidoreductase [Betaproteobacteria bacterium]|nr:molybdopterin-dependent oxidoreductase [Betaproteobacteria bacterium]